MQDSAQPLDIETVPLQGAFDSAAAYTVEIYCNEGHAAVHPVRAAIPNLLAIQVDNLARTFISA